jgi:hypothetical protein
MTIYRSALGKTIDMSAVATKNEKIRAVGNMNVNARGDLINNQNEIVTDRSNRIDGQYIKATQGTNSFNQSTNEHIEKTPVPVELTEEEKQLEQELAEEIIVKPAKPIKNKKEE